MSEVGTAAGLISVTNKAVTNIAIELGVIVRTGTQGADPFVAYMVWTFVIIFAVLCIPAFFETIATLPGGWDLAHTIRLGIKLFAELGANSQALSGSHVDSPCSCRAILRIGPGSDATVSIFC